MTYTYETIKQRHREVRDGYPDDLNLRLHRALSWWQRADSADDADGSFIFFWIAFNAAYATEISDAERLSEQSAFRAFLEKLCALDAHKEIDALVWQEFSGSIRVLLDNPYVFQAFWDHQSGKISEADWTERFERGKRNARQAIASGNTPQLLRVVFNRLYTLRNQLIHGGATCGSSVNRQQLHDCLSFLRKLVPVMIVLMMAHPEVTWGTACYPVVKP